MYDFPKWEWVVLRVCTPCPISQQSDIENKSYTIVFKIKFYIEYVKERANLDNSMLWRVCRV